MASTPARSQASLTVTSVTNSSSVDVAWSATGPAQGVPLVFVHGITEDRSLWAPVVERLAGDHRCVSLDLRGHGGSGGAEEYSSLAMVGDVADVVAASGVERPVVVGHSLGGMVASLYAASFPDALRAVVCVDQSLRLSDLAGVLRSIEGSLRDDFAGTMAAFWATQGAEVLDEATQERLATLHAEARSRDVVLGVWGTVFEATDEELLALVEGAASAVTVPYLALFGSDPARATPTGCAVSSRAPPSRCGTGPVTGPTSPTPTASPSGSGASRPSRSSRARVRPRPA